MCGMCLYSTVSSLSSTLLYVSGGPATMTMKNENESENSSRYSTEQYNNHLIASQLHNFPPYHHRNRSHHAGDSFGAQHQRRTYIHSIRIRIIACTLLCTYLPPPSPTHTPLSRLTAQTDPHSLPARRSPTLPPLFDTDDRSRCGGSTISHRILSHRIVSF